MENNEGTLKKSVRGGKWMLVNTIFQKVILLSSFLVLARLLVPEDFGVVSLLFVVPNLLNLLTTTGFKSALIQTKKDPKKYLNEVWTIDILRLTIIFIIIFFSAPFIASFFHIEKAIWAVRLSGIFLFITGFTNVAQLYFFKDIDFKKIFVRDALGSIFYSIVSVSFAIFYKSFWPLFLGYVAKHLSTAIATYVLHNYRPRLSFKFKKLKELIGYSKWIFGQNLVISAIPMIENGLIGRIVDATGVGLYSRAKSLASLPLSPLYNIFGKVTYPAYAKIQDTYGKIRDGFLKSLDLLFFLAIPFILLFLNAGHRIILIFLGEKWIGINALLKILMIAITFSTLSVLSGPIFNAIGKPKIQFYINITNIISLAFLFALLVPRYGTMGVATAVLTSSIFIFLISFLLLKKLLKIKILNVVKLIFVPLISSLAVFALGQFILTQTPISDFLFLLLISSLGILYIILVILFGTILKMGTYFTLKLIASEVLKRKN